MRIRKIAYILILLLSMSSLTADAATRRSNTQRQTNAAASQPQSGSGTDMSAEEEQALMDAAKAMRRSGLVQFNFKDMVHVRNSGREYHCSA